MAPEGEQWLVLSTTNRQGVYYRAPDGGVPYPFLEGVPPVARIGRGSIAIWEVSKNAEVQRGLAELYGRHGLADEAEGALRRTLAGLPYDAESRKRLVRLLRARGELARADSVVLGGPNPDVEMLLEWLSIRQELGDAEQTRAAFDMALQGFPDDPELKNTYAWWLQETGVDLDRALELVEDALRWSPQDPYFLDTRGMVHRQRGDPAAAIADFDAALAVPGGDLPAIRWHRALALADGGRMDAALEEVRGLAAREDLADALRVEIEQWLYEAGG
jgi:tetratricopeptide (TPR) repeat protein